MPARSSQSQQPKRDSEMGSTRNVPAAVMEDEKERDLLEDVRVESRANSSLDEPIVSPMRFKNAVRVVTSDVPEEIKSATLTPKSGKTPKAVRLRRDGRPPRENQVVGTADQQQFDGTTT